MWVNIWATRLQSKPDFFFEKKTPKPWKSRKTATNSWVFGMVHGSFGFLTTNFAFRFGPRLPGETPEEPLKVKHL